MVQVQILDVVFGFELKKINSQLYFMNSAPQGKPTPYFHHFCFKTAIKICDQNYEQSESSAYLYFFKVHLPLETTCLQTYRLFSN